MQSFKLILKTLSFFGQLNSISKNFKRSYFLITLTIFHSLPIYGTISVRDPHFTLKKYDLVMVLFLSKTLRSHRQGRVCGEGGTASGKDGRHPPATRARVRAGDSENRYLGSRCEALTRGQLPQVSDRQRDAVRWTAGGAPGQLALPRASARAASSSAPA